jgi:hypothetical protein
MKAAPPLSAGVAYNTQIVRDQENQGSSRTKDYCGVTTGRIGKRDIADEADISVHEADVFFPE